MTDHLTKEERARWDAGERQRVVQWLRKWAEHTWGRENEYLLTRGADAIEEAATLAAQLDEARGLLLELWEFTGRDQRFSGDLSVRVPAHLRAAGLLGEDYDA